MIERRGFLRGILAAGMAPAIVKAGVLMPLGKIWVPQAGLVTFGPMTIFTSETLRMLEKNLVFAKSVNRRWSDKFQIGQTISIRRPPKYVYRGKP